MDAAPPRASSASQASDPVQLPKSGGVRGEVIEILSNTANGVLAELGYYPGIVPQLEAAHAAIADLRKQNTALWEDNRRLAQCLEVVKARLTTVSATEEDRVERVLSLMAEGEALRIERDALSRTLAHTSQEGKMKRMLKELDSLTHKYQVALTDVALMHNNLVTIYTKPGPHTLVGPAPTSQAASTSRNNVRPHGNGVVAVPVAVPATRPASRDMGHQDPPRPQRQRNASCARPQALIPVPAEFVQKQAAHTVTQPGPDMYQPGGPAAIPSEQSMPRPGQSVPMTMQQTALPMHLMNQQTAIHHQGQRRPSQHHMAQPAQQRPIVQYVLNNTSIAHPHGQPVPRPDIHHVHALHQAQNPPVAHHAPTPPQHSATHSPFAYGVTSTQNSTPSNSRPPSSHSSRQAYPLSINTHISPLSTPDGSRPPSAVLYRRVSQHAYPMTPSTPSMNIREGDMQFPLTPQSARITTTPTKNVVTGAIRRREVEVTDLTRDDEPEQKRPRLDDVAKAAQAQHIAKLPSSTLPDGGTEKPIVDEPEPTAVDGELGMASPTEQEEGTTLPPERCAEAMFSEVEQGNPAKGLICYLCRHRYQTTDGAEQPTVFTSPTLDELVEHVKTSHPSVWDTF
ncbi:hypothetical protein OE88DRAFT_1731253 [Heliocybe sulcata]|uniref:Uncharacterized protein n=1 Tax=Heliocybe sulcata TaxID=5364 RepID=A0A5C3NE31_9AGAM|nr:hypothetical protein OE88DRAFT_1731253 [Heliocybe sulcata]